MITMNSKKKKFLIMTLIGLIIFVYLITKNHEYESKLKQISFEENINVKVIDAYNERGIYILNDAYFVNSATFIIGENTILIKDDAIWRPNNKKHIPRISDIAAPFILTKKKKNDTLTLIKDENKIHLLLKN